MTTGFGGVTNRGSRAGNAAAVLSVLAVVPIVAHLVEDATEDAFASFGLDPLPAAWLLGGALALQLTFALACLRERRAGYIGVALLSLAWVVTAGIEHWQAFVPGDFRAGLSSRIAVWGVIVLQGLAAWTALSAVRSTRRTSFTGTGSHFG